MSLHDKVIAWFACFASLTVILFVLGDYYQSSRALRLALESRASALSTQAAVEIDRRHDQDELALLRLAYGVANDRTREHALPADFATVRVFSADTLIWSRNAEELPPNENCAFGTVPFEARFTTLSGRSYRAEGVIPASQFFSDISAVSARLGRSAITSVWETGKGALVYDAACMFRSNANPSWVPREIASQSQVPMTNGQSSRIATAQPNRREHEYMMAISPVKEPAWSVVVALDYTRWAMPFVAARTQYLGLMIVVMLIALLIMLRVIRHDMLRLASIARAADAIGHGRLDVWLPPPTNDEVGRLSLALGGMVNRLATTMHKMELSAAMAAVGELATYLSHEIRNPLSSIKLNMQMLKRDLREGPVPEDAPKLVGLCLTELQRLDDVVKTVLEVGRRSREMSPGACDVDEIVLETLEVMDSKITTHGVAVEMRLAAGHMEVAIGGAKLKSVLINLVLNSIDAVAKSESKRIVIATDVRTNLQGEEYVELRLMDTGTGVPVHLRQRIFEPFFTTKTFGNGVGLATALRVITQCGGELHCMPQSEETGGAEFVLELPLASTIAQTSQPEGLSAAS